MSLLLFWVILSTVPWFWPITIMEDGYQVRGATDENDNSVLAEIPAESGRKLKAVLKHSGFREALKEAMNLAELWQQISCWRRAMEVIKTDPEQGQLDNYEYCSFEITASLTIVLWNHLSHFQWAKLRNWLNTDMLKCGRRRKRSFIKPGQLINNTRSAFWRKLKKKNRQADKQAEVSVKKSRWCFSSADVYHSKDSGFIWWLYKNWYTNSHYNLKRRKVPRTAKLLKLKIDTGLDPDNSIGHCRVLWTRIYYREKQISIVANLEPRTIKGIESKGMILMAEDKDGRLVMVTPAEKVSDGSAIK